MASKLSLYFLVCAFTGAVAGHPSVRARRSPEDSSSSSSEEDVMSFFTRAFEKTKNTVTGAVDKIQNSDTYQNTKDGLSNLADKVKEVGDNIRESDTFQNTKDGLSSLADKVREVGDNIRESDTYQNVKTSFSDAADKIKVKVKETLDD